MYAILPVSSKLYPSLCNLTLFLTHQIFTVKKNPNEACNPLLGRKDVFGVILGILFACITIIWAGYRYTAESVVGGER